MLCLSIITRSDLYLGTLSASLSSFIRDTRAICGEIHGGERFSDLDNTQRPPRHCYTSYSVSILENTIHTFVLSRNPRDIVCRQALQLWSLYLALDRRHDASIEIATKHTPRYPQACSAQERQSNTARHHEQYRLPRTCH